MSSLLLASNSQVLSAVIRIVMRFVLGFYRQRARQLGLARAIGERVCKMLGRRGMLGDANHESNEPEVLDAALAACRKVALSRGRFERIDERGRAQQELFADEVLVSRKKNDPWVGEHKGFTLHAGVRIGALDRTRRERIVRYCTRPPVAMERLSILRDGSVAYRLKHANKRPSHRVMVRYPKPGKGRPITVPVPATLDVDQARAVKLFALDRWLPSLLSWRPRRPKSAANRGAS